MKFNLLFQVAKHILVLPPATRKKEEPFQQFQEAKQNSKQVFRTNYYAINIDLQENSCQTLVTSHTLILKVNLQQLPIILTNTTPKFFLVIDYINGFIVV